MIETQDKKIVLISGGTGFVGSALSDYLKAEGCLVRHLSRQPKHEGQFIWHPDDRTMDKNALDAVDTVIHLAGETLFNKRWSKQRKTYILDNRRLAAETLVENISALKALPKTVIVASAIGFYGDRGDVCLDEASAQGDDFPSKVCQAIETAFAPLISSGVRVVIARFGVVLGCEGGALKKMRLPFSLGLGGHMGPGKQWMSWIQLEDCVRAMHFLMERSDLQGHFNLTSPQPVTNAEFSKALASALHRPCLFPLPAFVIRLIFGEMGESLLLASAKVMPKRLLDSGFEFKAPGINEAVSIT